MNQISVPEEELSFFIADKVYDKFGDPEFRSKKFHCYSDLPLEWRMTVMTNTLEGEVINGGLAQFLWNNFLHYKTILNDSKLCYNLIGAPKQEMAVEKFINLCSKYELICKEIIERSLADNSNYFNEWYEEFEQKMMCEEEKFVDCDSDTMNLKGVWINKNISLYKELL